MIQYHDTATLFIHTCHTPRFRGSLPLSCSQCQNRAEQTFFASLLILRVLQKLSDYTGRSEANEIDAGGRLGSPELLVLVGTTNPKNEERGVGSRTMSGGSNVTPETNNEDYRDTKVKRIEISADSRTSTFRQNLPFTPFLEKTDNIIHTHPVTRSSCRNIIVYTQHPRCPQGEIFHFKLPHEVQ